MPSRTIFLSRLIGLFTILVSLSLLLHKQSMVEKNALSATRKYPAVISFT